MRMELELSLREKYPVLFGDLHGDPKATCMSFGCNHGDGWYDLLDRTCSKIASADPEAKLLQVKEKFGLLTIYLQGNEEAWEVASEAAVESQGICELCGLRECVEMTSGWLSVRCEKCLADESKNKEGWNAR
jgi:hypothetical protein